MHLIRGSHTKQILYVNLRVLAVPTSLSSKDRRYIYRGLNREGKLLLLFFHKRGPLLRVCRVITNYTLKSENK